MTERRVVVTAQGAITPIGTGVPDYWESLLAARSGIARINSFDATPFDSQIAGECRDFDVASFADVRSAKRMDRFSQLAFAASLALLRDGDLTEGKFDPRRAGVIIGSGIGGLREIEDQHHRLINKGPGKVSAFTIPKLMANASSGHISIHHNFQGINTSVATACASAGNAIGDAFNAIRHNIADLMITGGTEAAVTPLGLAAFAAMKALSTRNDDPEHASRPFDRNRDGFVLSEGCGLLLLEEHEHAKARGANILAEVVGYGASADAEDMVQPSSDGGGAARAMAAALADARINPDQIDYINAHGTSTPLGDVAETKAVKRVFGAQTRVAVSSTKSCTGHLLGASGGIEAIACIQALIHNTLPPTANLEEPDPECDLDYVPNTPRDANVRHALCNSFGFGGHNACLVFKKV